MSSSAIAKASRTRADRDRLVCGRERRRCGRPRRPAHSNMAVGRTVRQAFASATWRRVERTAPSTAPANASALSFKYPPAGRHISVRPEQIPFLDVMAAGAHGLGEIARQYRSAAIVMRGAEKDDRPWMARKLSRHVVFSELYGDGCMRPLIDCSDPAKPGPARHAAF